MRGTSTLPIEVTNISPHGFWVLLENGSAEREELFLPFTDFPWFRAATIEQLCKVERPSADHLYWPQLDIDLSVHSIRDPAAFPLISR